MATKDAPSHWPTALAPPQQSGLGIEAKAKAKVGAMEATNGAQAKVEAETRAAIPANTETGSNTERVLSKSTWES